MVYVLPLHKAYTLCLNTFVFNKERKTYEVTLVRILKKDIKIFI
jgi:hypothetical protein